MDYVNAADRVAAPVEDRVGGFANISAKAIFVSLLALIVFTAVPYGTVEPWWKAFFICAVVALSLLALVESMVSGSWSFRGRAVLIPLAIATYSLSYRQCLSVPERSRASLTLRGRPLVPIHTGPGFSSSNFLRSLYPPLSSFATYPPTGASAS